MAERLGREEAERLGSRWAEGLGHDGRRGGEAEAPWAEGQRGWVADGLRRGGGNIKTCCRNKEERKGKRRKKMKKRKKKEKEKGIDLALLYILGLKENE